MLSSNCPPFWNQNALQKGKNGLQMSPIFIKKHPVVTMEHLILLHGSQFPGKPGKPGKPRIIKVLFFGTGNHGWYYHGIF